MCRRGQKASRAVTAAQVCSETAWMQMASIHALRCWYAYIFIWLDGLFLFECWITILAEQYQRKCSPLPALILSSPSWRQTSATNSAFGLLQAMKNLGNHNTVEIAKPTMPLYLACKLSGGNSSEVSTNECYQETACT